MERGTTSARNCGINPGADWGWKHWTTGGTDGFGRGQVRDRGASRWRRAGPRACKPFSLPRRSTKCLRHATSSFLAASLIAATHGLINADRLAVMKPGACLMQVGRGAQLTRPLWSKHYVRGALVRRLMCLNASHRRRNPRHGVSRTCVRRIRQALPISSGTVTTSCCPTICGATSSISG